MISKIKWFFRNTLGRFIAGLWDSIYRIRRYAYRFGLLSSYHFDVPIFAVGNITFGGTGKTPFTLWLANNLSSTQKKGLILTRGYKGQLEHSHGHLKCQSKLGHCSRLYGDEPSMMIRKLKHTDIVVGKNRGLNLLNYFDEVKPSFVILDDGFQHLKIKSTLNFVLIDSLMPISQYMAPPLGYLREGLTSLDEADYVILGRADLVGQENMMTLQNFLKPYLKKNTRILRSRYVPLNIRSSDYQVVMTIEDLKGIDVFCFAGIASPSGFFQMIKNTGANIIDTMVFPDHSEYAADVIDEIIKRAKDALIVTTEKDIVKMKNVKYSPRIYFLDIEMEILDQEQELLNEIRGFVL